jgi:Flp pilus assembly pilin Flp
MADSAREAWNEVGDKFGEWSRLLGERYRKRGQELGTNTEEDRKKLDEAIQTVTRQVDQAFTSLGETLRDPEAKQHLKEATKSLGDALSTTFSEVGDQIRSKLGSSGSSGSTGSTGSSGSSTQAD